MLRGEISLIGPRAEWVECADRYKKKIPFYHFRHLVKPGITGWAQVNYPYGESDDDAVEKLKFDLYYIRHILADARCHDRFDDDPYDVIRQRPITSYGRVSQCISRQPIRLGGLSQTSEAGAKEERFFHHTAKHFPNFFAFPCQVVG